MEQIVPSKEEGSAHLADADAVCRKEAALTLQMLTQSGMKESALALRKLTVKQERGSSHLTDADAVW